MEKDELIRNEDPVSCGSPDPPPPPPPDKPGMGSTSSSAGDGTGAEASFCRAATPVSPAAPVVTSSYGWATACRSAGREPTLSPPKPAASQTEESILYISEDEAKDAFIQFAASKCCYRTAPSKHMVVRSLTALNTYRYRLQTFTESRSTLPASEPYRGGFVDSPETAVPPEPWDVAVDPPPLFADCKMHLPVPHTYSVQGCPSCSGAGRAPCGGCGGLGTSTCIFCGGSGRCTNNDIYSNCPHCGGTGRRRCFSCHGEGRVPCARCGTKGLLLCHSELTITWKNSVAEYVVDKNQGFPLSRFQEVTGKQLFSDEHHLVICINTAAPSLSGNYRTH
ncbi:protein SSUH2 homolog isoform X2 [Calonectris borealis]|uniref:protein SSUH2 homolog isoform X2 n=1 Tax=Calonectris borealis TaxID=1323832 RepID=UPI003F4BEDE0